MDEKTLRNQEAIRMLAGQMSLMPQPPTQRLDVFTPGIYIRNLRMPATYTDENGVILQSCFVTEKHLSEHPYNIMSGKLKVWTSETGTWQVLKAPGFGITKPGTQRLFIIEEEVLWQTIHATTIYPENDTAEAHEKAVRLITDLIIEKVDYSLYQPKESEVIE